MPGNRKSIRLKDCDYAQQGAYYVTVCVDDYLCGGNLQCRGASRNAPNTFGDIENGAMKLNAIGRIRCYAQSYAWNYFYEKSNTSGNRLWQRNFFEHVVRNDSDLSRIREYIMNNPAQWVSDEYYFVS